MNSGSETAEQLVKMSLDGVEVVAKLTGAGAKQLAALLYAILTQKKKTRGQLRLQSMLASGKELKVFAFKKEDLKKFCSEAKRYGIGYAVIRPKDNANGLVDLMVRTEDASRINRVFEHFNLATVDIATINKSLEKVRVEKQAPDTPKQNEAKTDALLCDMLGEKTPQTAAAPIENPTAAQKNDAPSEKSSDKEKSDRAKIFSEPQAAPRPSVRKELENIKKKQTAQRMKTPDAPTKGAQHQAPQMKKKTTKTKEKVL